MESMDLPGMAMDLAPGRPEGPRFLEQLPLWLAQAIPGWLPRQRWFGSKGRTILKINVRDAALLATETAETLQALVLLDVHFGDDRGSETYFLPVCLLEEAAAARLDPACVITRIPWRSSTGTLTDGLADEQLRRSLLLSLTQTNAPSRLLGSFHFQRTAHLDSLFPWLPSLAATGGSRLLRAEQSNTSMVFSENGQPPRLLLKCFRRVMPGLNPDYELTRTLTEQTTFRAVPLLAGSIAWQAPARQEPQPELQHETWILGIFQAFVANQGDGWEYTLRELKSLLAEEDRGRSRQLLEAIRLLARRTAELHLALAGVANDPAIAPELMTAEDLRQWEQQIAGEMLAAGHELEHHLADLPQPWRSRAAAIARALVSGRASAMPPGLTHGVKKIRIHGDYHLGQVLRTDSDFVLFDFEGEPARPLAWRRRKWCVLKDVAGMLRSFGYAAHVAAAEIPDHDRQAQEWEESARHEFWTYWERLIRSGNPVLLPDSGEDARAALRVFELEKAIYELGYELHHRPDWVGVPLAGLERLLEVDRANHF